MSGPSEPSTIAAAAFEAASLTNTGRVRDTNEDSLITIPKFGVFVVADGVGGLSAGDIASQRVCQTIRERLKEYSGHVSDTFVNNAIRAAVGEANEWIIAESDLRNVRAMGTTVVLLALSSDDPAKAVALHAGDRRVYQFRDKQLTQLTEDHSLAGQLGVDEQNLPYRMQGVITRAVGIQQHVELEETEVAVAAGDVYLICSDGLTRMVKDERLTEMLIEGADDLNETAKQMVDEANEKGGFDNISLILVRVGD